MNREELIKSLKETLIKGGSKTFTVADKNGNIVINGDIIIPSDIKLPVLIDEVYGNVSVSNITEPITHGKLTSLENFPKVIHGSFICKLNDKLTSLEGGPTVVDRDFICIGCGLTSLDGMPTKVGGNFLVYNNNIKDLSPVLNSKIVGSIDAQFNPCESSKLYKQLLAQNKMSAM